MITTARQAYAMLANESLWNVAARCHELLDNQNIPHAICEGVAVALHGYRRNTVDVDLVIRAEDVDKIRSSLVEAGFQWNAGRREFLSREGVAIQFLLAGDRAGPGSEVRLPDPADSRVVQILEGLPALNLSKLIESKLACGEANLRRTHKDFADVVELISIHRLTGEFARHLHRSLRKSFRELVRNTRSEE